MTNNMNNISSNNSSVERNNIMTPKSRNNNSNSWLLGLNAFVISIIGIFAEPYILVLFLDIIAFVLAIIALAKRCRLKGFSIAAIVIAVVFMMIGAINVTLSVFRGDNWASGINYSADSISNSSNQGTSSYNSTKNDADADSDSKKVIVKVIDKENFSQNISAGRLLPYCELTIKVSNYTKKDVKGVQGIITIKDMFGKEFMKSSCDLTGTTIPAGKAITFKRGMDINEFINNDVKLYNENYEDLQFEYKVTDIVYE